MKKNIIYSAFIFIAISLFASCSDFLDEDVRGQQDLTQYFKNESECKQQITGCYQSIFWDDWWQIQKLYLANDMCTDDMWIGNLEAADQKGYSDLAQYTGNTYAAGESVQNFWQYRYKGILRSNVAITKIPNVKFKNESLKNRYIAEAKFLRAFHYFELVKNFGGVPLVEGLLLPSELRGIKRASLADSYAMIEKDLTDAIAYLPTKSEYSSSDNGRATKGAAQGYLAKVYLYQDKYTEAETVLKELIGRSPYPSQSEYALLPNFGDVWSVDVRNSKESLFEVQTNSDIAYNLGLRMPVVCGSRNDGGWAWGLPTSNLEKAFVNAGDTLRLKWTIIKDGAKVVPGDPAWTAAKPYSVAAKDHKSGRISRKVYIPAGQRPSPYDASHNPLNYRLLRYADVLLMYAEVENELGNDTEARWALNEVRNRALLASDVTSTGTALRDVIRKERRLELALENERLFDLRRWKGDDGKPVICSVMGPNGSFVLYNTVTSTDSYEKSGTKENSNKGIAFSEKRDLLYPIPVSEITLSGGDIVQNPGYN